NTVTSRSNSATNASRLACDVGRASVSVIAVSAVSVTQFLPGEVDEDGLERRLGDQEVLYVDARRVRRSDDSRQQPAATAAQFHLHGPGRSRGARDAVDLAQHFGKLLHAIGGVHGD